jgi:ATP-dependent Clp protease ATP-binding subunit ClpC
LFQAFTNRARHVVVLAQEQARTLRHERIGSEHLLLGILDESEGAGAQVLARLVGDAGTVSDALLAAVPAGTGNPPQKIPMTEKAKEILGHANAQATALGHNYVGTEHLLLALMKVEDSTALQVLAGLGVTYDGVRDALIAWTAAFIKENPDAAARIAQAQARAAAGNWRLEIAGADDTSA